MATTGRRELSNDLGILLRAALAGNRAETWTAMPAIIKSFDPTKMTCEAYVAIKLQAVDENGNTSWFEIAPLVDCPVVFPGGGGFTLTFPLEAGDEALIVFASRCIDAWWTSGQIGIQNELRMHNISDGFVIPGVRSVPNVLSNVSTSAVQLRNDDGTAHISIDGDGEIDLTTEGSVKVVAAEADVTAPAITLTGNVVINGTLDVTGIVEAADFKPLVGPAYLEHKHNIIHGSDLGPPVPYP